MGARFGEAARNARIEREVSLKTVADHLGWTPAYVSDIERGNRNPPSAEKVKQWARLIHVDPDQFLRDAALDRPSIELPIEGNPSKGELALMLARAWEQLTKDQEAELMKELKRITGVTG